VRDAESNQALVGASVQIVETGAGVVTDAEGGFRFSVPQGQYSLRVKFIGYADKSERINVDRDLDLSIVLQETYQLTDEVVVVATRADEKTPATYTNVDQQAIRKQNFGQDLPFLLNWTPSVVTTSDAGTGVGYTGLRIRGSDATRINVTINGIPYNDSESLGTFWVDIPDIASSSKSIQIQRGVGTSTNGAGAFGATINLQTNTRNDTPYGEIISSAGSFGTFRNTLSFGTGLLNNRWVLDGRISRIVSDGFIDRASSDLQSYYFAAGYYAGRTMVKAIAFGGKERTYQSWYGVPESRLNNDAEAMELTVYNEGWNEEQRQNLLTSDSRTFNPYTYQNQVDDYQQDHYQLHFSRRLGNYITGNASLHYTRGNGYYEEYKYDGDFADYGLPDVVIQDDDGTTEDNDTISSTDFIRRRWLDNHFYGITYSLNYEKGNLNSILGGSWNRYDGDHFGEILWSEVSVVPIEYQYYFNTGDKRDFNVFLKNNYQFSEKLNAYVDLQFRRITYETYGIENEQNLLDVNADYNFFNPKAGVVYTVRENEQLYASYSIANREPVRDDFVDAPGVSRPKHETLRNLEAGYKRTGAKYAFNINYYLMDYKNQLVLTGELNDVGASVRTNVDKSYRMGIELEWLLKFSDKFSWNANLSLSRNKISDFTEIIYDYGEDWEDYNEVRTTYTDTDISFSPGVVASSGLTWSPVKNLEATLLTKYVGRQYLDNTSNTDRSIDPYLVNDVRLSYVISPSFAKKLALSVIFNNILNEEYESNGYTWGYAGGGDQYRENYYYPQAGRNYIVMLSLAF
ncbi:MAG TPA: TonB-dependent receptor, partial [Ohtaekwangia sp.]|nr:TonB-dependent receptor [Ohtaekwangia sp.]